MPQKLKSHSVEQSEDFFYLPKLYVGPDPEPVEQAEEIYVVGSINVINNILVGGTVDGVDVAALKTDVDGFPDQLKSLVTAEIQQLENIGATTISAAQWGYLGGLDQALATASSPTFAALTVTNNILVGGTVDGVDVAALKTDVDGFPDQLKSLVTAEIQQLENIGATTISAAQWGYLGELDQALTTASSPTFAALTVTNNIVVGGTVDGVDVAALKTAYDAHDHSAADPTQVDHANLTNILADQHHAGFIGLEDNAAVAIVPAADDRIQITDDGVINANAAGNTLALSIAQAQIDHGTIGGLADDDHPQYFLLAGETTDAKLYSGADLIVYSDAGVTEKARIDGATGNITTAGTVDGVDVAALKTDVDGFPDQLKSLVTAEIQQLENIGATTISAAQWGYLGGLNQALTTTSSPTFAALTVTNNIVVGGTVDGVDVAALKTDVDGFPDSLKNLTAAEITQLTNIGAVTISAAQWGYLGGLDQALATTSKPQFAGVNLGGAVYYLGSGAAASKLYVLYINEIYADLGAANDPSYTFNGDTDTGMYSAGANTISFTTGAGLRLTINSSGITVAGSVAVTGTVDGVDVAALKTDVDGFPDSLKNLTAAEITQLTNIGAVTISAAQWGYLGGLNQALATTNSPTFAALTVTNNIVVGGTVDGVDVAGANAASFVTLGVSGFMANERVLTAGDGINITDGGAGTTATVAQDALGADVYRTADQTIANITWTAIQFNVERWDTDVCHDNVTNNTRLTCKTAGVYVITGGVSFAYDADGARFVSIFLNGTEMARMQVYPYSLGTAASITDILKLAVNDYVELKVYHNAGGNLNVIGTVDRSPNFKMVFCGQG